MNNNNVADSLQDIESIGPGEICAIFGVDCTTGDTFNDGATSYTMVYQQSPRHYNGCTQLFLVLNVRP